MLLERFEEALDLPAVLIYYCVRFYPGGPASLAEACRPHLGNTLLLEGLEKIRTGFLRYRSESPPFVLSLLRGGVDFGLGPLPRWEEGI